MNNSNAPSADFPQAVITPNAVLRAIGEKPDCGMKHLQERLIFGKKGGTLAKVKEIRDSLKENGYITVVSYQHTLTEKGKKAFSHLPSEDVQGVTQLQEPAMA